MSDKGVVIVGAGQAGAQLALSLRQLKYDGPITLLGDEVEPPYQRPPLSKAFMQGKVELPGLLMRTPAIYEQQNIDWRPGLRVRKIDRAAQQVELTSGERLDYASLVLATGTRNRRLDVPGADLEGVVFLRTFQEADKLRSELGQPRQIVVIGGGFVGLEFAAVAKAMGHSVTVLEAGSRLMSRALSSVSSEYFRRLHQRAGVSVRCGAAVTALEGEAGKVQAVTLSDGQRLPADLVVVGIGVVPNCELAQEAGLTVDNGICVDARLQTNDPHIFAMGDCAAFPSPYLAAHAGTQVRLESVQNAVDQAKHLAARLMGASSDYNSIPWFWSDQYDRKLQIAGLTQGADEWAISGDTASGVYGVHCFGKGRWLGFESVNQPAEHMLARKLLASGRQFTWDDLQKRSFDMRSALEATH